MFKYPPPDPDAMHAAIVALWNSDKGKEWREHPRNIAGGKVPRFDPPRYA